jgi:nucleoside-diphosphate-sugar epimerase
MAHEYFKNKNILITGGTGFLGKVLLRKIISKCPDVGKIYILIRPRDKLSSRERFKLLLQNSMCFNQIKENIKDVENHFKIIEGDLNEGDLGISKIDLEDIMTNVNIIINAGASISWKEKIDKIVDTNIKSTQKILEIAQKSNLDHLIHISTIATVGPKDLILNKKVLGENFNFNDYVKFIDEIRSDSFKIDQETSRIHNLFGSTYAFTKSGSDMILHEKSRKDLKTTIILCPSLGVSLYDPTPGWLDNLTGYLGNYFYLGLGKSYAYLLNKNAKIFELPVDIFANYVINISNIYGSNRDKEKLDLLNTNNLNTISLAAKQNLTIYESFEIALEYFKKYPLSAKNFIQPKFFFSKKEYDNFIEFMSSTSLNEHQRKILNKTKIFNMMYEQINYKIPEIEFPDDSEKIIKLCSDLDLKTFPLEHKNLNYKDYIKMSCEGIHKHYIDNSKI